MSFPNYVTGTARVALGRKWGRASAVTRQAARMKREPDWHTQRMRALHDAKGQVLREGCTYTAAGATNWQVRRSIAGRINQLDLVANSTIIKTCGSRRLPRRFKP